ncbi:MAG: nucleotidyltransferase family protein [Phycisphaerae bacterium]|nr:nucleotidyltransferase family protein [Phycisphaerae bacterium]
MRTVGLLLAAGQGSRMGRLKQLIPFPGPADPPLVAVAHDAISPACGPVIVVVAHEADRVLDALRPRHVHAVRIQPGLDMSESIRAGLGVASHLFPHADVLLHPADHPRVAPETLQSLRAALDRDPRRAVIPTHAGRGGHPILIPAHLVLTLSRADLAQGLADFWRRNPHLSTRLPVPDPGVCADLDRPADLAAADAATPSQSTPPRPEDPCSGPETS